ncbi:MAG TPA: sigma-70 family RNA polymerase sigma factor [Phycisphaerae bacterium]|nr:sigma-70 family RNA polymerase sigma factor [Phycisphaerae bacterium]
MEPGNADAFLVEQIRQGSQVAWRQLIQRYEGRLLAFARARTARFADAEDLVQDTFIGFAQSLPHYDSARSLETYLFTILRYKLCDLLRSRKIEAINAPVDEDDWWDQITTTAGETPSGVAARAEAAKVQESLLTDALRHLIHELRDRNAFDDLQVIELVFYAGKRNLEVADLFEIDQKAVAGIKFRAIQKLQKHLGQADESALASLNETSADVTVARVWRERRLTCLKRSTLGSYLLGVLEEPWLSYTQFHLNVVGCPMCVANLQDLEEQEVAEEPAEATDRIFASSAGFLKTATQE